MSKQDQKLETFEECCEYLGISEELPRCQIRERQHQAAYKLSVCMHACNKQDEFELDETANFYQEKTGYTPRFDFKNGRLLSTCYANSGSFSGIAYSLSFIAAPNTTASIGLRLCLKTWERAVQFGQTFIQIFNELI